jgi:hypothetical protein
VEQAVDTDQQAQAALRGVQTNRRPVNRLLALVAQPVRLSSGTPISLGLLSVLDMEASLNF